MIELVTRGATDVGKKRSSNEDALGVDDAMGVYLLADGMGGHATGARASKEAVAVVHAELTAARAVFDRFRDDPREDHRAAILQAMVTAFEKGCAHVFELGREAGHTRRRMGSTLDAAVRVGDQVLLGHVGDGRVYLLRQGKCYQLTEDHTIIADQLKAGILTPADALESPFKGVLTRAIGTHRSVKVDTLLVELNAGDVLLMCSDGLHKHVTPEDLLSYVKPEMEPAQVSRLVDLANSRGGSDNITAIWLACHERALPADASPAKKPLRESSSGRVLSRIDAICRLPLFRHLSYREQVAVLSVAKSRLYEAGATIVKEGDRGQEMFVLIEGELVVERGGVKIATLGAGGHFGEMSIVEDAPRSATVKAKVAADVLVIGQAELTGLMRVDPVLGVKVLWNFTQVLSMRLRTASAELTDLLVNEAPPATVRTPFEL